VAPPHWAQRKTRGNTWPLSPNFETLHSIETRLRRDALCTRAVRFAASARGPTVRSRPKDNPLVVLSPRRVANQFKPYALATTTLEHAHHPQRIGPVHLDLAASTLSPLPVARLYRCPASGRRGRNDRVHMSLDRAPIQYSRRRLYFAAAAAATATTAAAAAAAAAAASLSRCCCVLFLRKYPIERVHDDSCLNLPMVPMLLPERFRWSS
jgi:hypothetical protein